MSETRETLWLVILENQLSRATAEIDRLRSYLMADARCPCCDTTETCLDGCTFRDDAPDGWERMTAARKALKGTP